MKRTLLLVALAVFSLAPCSALSQSNSMASMGMGAHGYDFLVGTWMCVNSVPSPVGGPATSQLTASRSGAGDSISVHLAGTGFDALGYVSYSSKTKTWYGPTAYADGSYSTESSQQTGNKVVWSGSYFDAASGKSIPIRDTYTLAGSGKYTDLSESQIGDTWKTSGNITCTKS